MKPPPEPKPWLSEFDLHLFGEGTHQRLYEKMGAQQTLRDGVAGVNFALWAPNATAVSVIGDHNRWDADADPMHPLGRTGVWERFVPGLRPGALYKFHIRASDGRATIKADPYGSYMELRPNTASVVYDLGRYTWGDGGWMASRAERQRSGRPLAIYEVHPGSWKRKGGELPDWLSWRELAADLVPYVKRMGFTHIELLPVTEHPYDGSWGYQSVGYFAPTSRHGTPDDFRHFIDTAHQAGLGVILDWVPAHFPKDAHGLGFFDGTHLYEHADPRRGEHRDWGTLIFNLARPQVSGLLLASAAHGSTAITSTGCAWTRWPHALPRLSRARRVDAQSRRAENRPFSFSSVSTRWSTNGSQVFSRSPRNPPRGRRSPGRSRREASASTSNGTWGG
jgi:1,4-alpha-glucan branching enzyme